MIIFLFLPNLFFGYFHLEWSIDGVRFFEKETSGNTVAGPS